MNDMYKRLALAIAGQVLPTKFAFHYIIKSLKRTIFFTILSAITASGFVFACTIFLNQYLIQNGVSLLLSTVIVCTTLLALVITFGLISSHYMKCAVRARYGIRLFAKPASPTSEGMASIITAFFDGYNNSVQQPPTTASVRPTPTPSYTQPVSSSQTTVRPDTKGMHKNYNDVYDQPKKNYDHVYTQTGYASFLKNKNIINT